MKKWLLLLFLTAVFLMNACSDSKSMQENISTSDTVAKFVEGDCLQALSAPAFKFSRLQSIDFFKQTEIVPTLENSTAKNKNSIYAVSFLLAWNEIKKGLNDPIVLSDTCSNDFKLINRSKSFENVLKKSEYKTEIDYSDAIIAKAYFEKFLPFANAFDEMNKPIRFNNVLVDAFGMNVFSTELARIIHIYYYDSNDHFVIGIETQDVDHEIIFAKGVSLDGSMLSIFNNVNQIISTGAIQKIKTEHAWKYSFTRVDQFAVPKLNFNIETNYKNIEEQYFSTANKKNHVVLEAYQQIAFNLDQNGVAVSDFSRICVDSMGNEQAVPKKIIFDKPFFCMMKRKDASCPYFAMKIMNAELMVKK